MEMLAKPDRSHLSLPLESVSTSNGNSASRTTINAVPKQQKLIKSLSIPADYSVSVHYESQSPSSSSHKESKAHPLSRAQSIRETISNGTAKFFGVPPSEDNHSQLASTAVDPKWKSRRLRFICKRYGNVKEEAVFKELCSHFTEDFSDVSPSVKNITPQDEAHETAFREILSRSKSVESQGSKIIQHHLERRDSVMKMTYDRLSAIVQRKTLRPKKTCAIIKRGRSTSSSFAPFTIQQAGNITHIKINPSVTDVSVSGKGMCTVPEVDFENSYEKNEVKNKTDELKKETEAEEGLLLSKKSRSALHFQSKVEIHPFDDVKAQREVIRQDQPLLVSEQNVSEQPSVNSAHLQVQASTAFERKALQEKACSFSSVPLSSMDSVQDEVFFDYTPPEILPSISDAEKGQQIYSLHSQRGHDFVSCRKFKLARNDKNLAVHEINSISTVTNRPSVPGSFNIEKQVRHRVGRRNRLHRQKSFDNGLEIPVGYDCERSLPFASLRNVFSSPKEWLLQNIPYGGGEKEIKTLKTHRSVQSRSVLNVLDTIHEKLKCNKYYVPRRRRFGGGFGIWRKYFNRRYKKDAYFSYEDTYIDYRPFFTYWVTTVQVLVMIISLCTYGVGPWGFGLSEETADVLHTTVTLKRDSIYVQQNIWLGPKFADLIHLGAKFTPCMREDPRIFAQINADRKEENETGCCIYNDGTGCFQTGHRTCPSLIATLTRWNDKNPGPDKRLSGAVCGQDPRYCEDPVSVKPYEWPDDITQWPICKQRTSLVPENEKHMQCEITGRPCCIQLHGQCRITTRDYCDFVNGYFHENATLCSQISCLSEICGMLPFLRRDQPDQWYRLFIPLFLHAGIFHCVITIFIQIFYMRDLEKLLGWARIALLYMMSGIGGYLASAIFVPYRPEVGPAGSHVGMFATMYVDVVYSWNLLERPWHAIMQLSIFTLSLFSIGTLPWIDNWAHLFGFIFGILISLAVLPYIQTRRRNRAKRLLIVITSLSIAFGLLFVLLAVFYSSAGLDCPYCEYFNCIPYTYHFCDNQGLRLKTWLPI